jgi:hypothetical protein
MSAKTTLPAAATWVCLLLSTKRAAVDDESCCNKDPDAKGQIEWQPHRNWFFGKGDHEEQIEQKDEGLQPQRRHKFMVKRV